MLLPVAGAVLVGIPGVVLGLWFSWLSRRCWLKGGVMLVMQAWGLCLAVIAGGLALVLGALVHTEFGLLHNILAAFVVFVIAGGIPSAVIAVVVSFLTYLMEGASDYDEWIALDCANGEALVAIAFGTVSGLVTSVFSLRLSLNVMDAVGI